MKLDSTQLVAEVSKFLKTGDKIYVLDQKSNSIFCFDTAGTLKWKYSKFGRGPEDHDKLVDFSLRNNRIYLLDKINKILVLDTTGKFVFKKKLPYQELSFFTNFIFVNEYNDLVTYNYDLGNGKQDMMYKIVVLDSTLSKIKRVFLKKYNHKGEKLWRPNPFPLQDFTNNTGFYYTEAVNDTIYAYSGDSLQRKYVIDFGKNTAPASFRDKSNLSLSDFWTSKYGGNIAAVFDADSLLIFKTQIAGLPYFHFYDKNTKGIATFKNVLLKSKDFYSVVNFIGGEGNRLFFTVEPVDVLEAYKYFRRVKYKDLTAENLDTLLKKQFPLYHSLLEGINIYSNQIILSIEIPKKTLFKNNE